MEHGTTSVLQMWYCIRSTKTLSFTFTSCTMQPSIIGQVRSCSNVGPLVHTTCSSLPSHQLSLDFLKGSVQTKPEQQTHNSTKQLRLEFRLFSLILVTKCQNWTQENFSTQRVNTSASRNTILSWNFQLVISAPFPSWNFRLQISELKFRAEIFWVEIFSSENELKFRAEIFLVEIFSSEKELKFRVEILASRKIWVENLHYVLSLKWVSWSQTIFYVVHPIKNHKA